MTVLPLKSLIHSKRRGSLVTSTERPPDLSRVTHLFLLVDATPRGREVPATGVDEAQVRRSALLILNLNLPGIDGNNSSFDGIIIY
ncbi:hypothetical protein RHMOL_Rhmol11G0135200 [Rhododendron molle]|uniref:Uncharacterized protein n=1 Tax=Rhododendron molle TaxID=49168 RepID=A0ACC0LTI0_RHOML|nr:hypothetical protein RHMOL_Rhmol11G0135200 [Rhododendron molle]